MSQQYSRWQDLQKGPSVTVTRTAQLEELRQRVHEFVIDQVGPMLADEKVSEHELRRIVHEHVNKSLSEENIALSAAERAQLVQDVTDDTMGCGPIDRYLQDPGITEVMVNGPKAVYIERRGRIEETDVQFVDEGHLRRTIDKIVGQVGRRIDERIVTIEDAKELKLWQEHVCSLESRPPNIEGEGEIRIRELVRNSLRMRPDRIIVGEARGAEALDMLQAMNTGHDGSLTTIHANSPRECLQRLEVMVLMAGYDLPVKAIRQQVGAAVHVLVQAARLTH